MELFSLFGNWFLVFVQYSNILHIWILKKDSFPNYTIKLSKKIYSNFQKSVAPKYQIAQSYLTLSLICCTTVSLTKIKVQVFEYVHDTRLDTDIALAH